MTLGNAVKFNILCICHVGILFFIPVNNFISLYLDHDFIENFDLSLTVLVFVVMTTCGTTSEDRIGIMITLSIQGRVLFIWAHCMHINHCLRTISRNTLQEYSMKDYMPSGDYSSWDGRILRESPSLWFQHAIHHICSLLGYFMNIHEVVCTQGPWHTETIERNTETSGSYMIPLTHWGWDQMVDISQTLSNTFSWMKLLELRLKFQWTLFLRV